MATPFMLSQDNIEMQFATNHLGMLPSTSFPQNSSAPFVILVAFGDALFYMIFWIL